MVFGFILSLRLAMALRGYLGVRGRARVLGRRNVQEVRTLRTRRGWAPPIMALLATLALATASKETELTKLMDA